MYKRWIAILALAVFLGIFAAACSSAPTPAPTPLPDVTVPGSTPMPTAIQGSPVTLNGKTIFYVRTRTGSLTPAERADLITNRLEAIANNPFRTNLQVRLQESEEGTDIFVDQDLILTVSDRDALALGITRAEVAERAATILQAELTASRAQINVEARTRGWFQTALLLGVLVLLLWLVNRIYHRLERMLNQVFAKQLARKETGEPLRYASQPLRLFLLFLLRLARIIVWILLVLVLLPLVLTFFPTTYALYEQLIELVREPLIVMWEGFIQFLPNLFFIIVIAVVAWIFIRGERSFFDQVEKGNIRVSGFEADWAPLTKNLLMILLVALTLVIVFPYLPFSDAPAFQGISIFFGLLITLSSSSAIANLIAGVLLTYNGAFKVGDLVELGNNIGTVTEKRLFTTSVRTFKNEIVSVPNSVVIGASIRNFSALAKKTGLILHSEVTIGYDAPWRQVHQLMIDAAKATTDISPEPPPFVLQRALNDWHISYEINAYTHNAEKMPRIMSELLSNIQDAFNAAGIEIMSPTFYALRDGNTVTIPESERPAGYQVPSFRIVVDPDK